MKAIDSEGLVTQVTTYAYDHLNRWVQSSTGPENGPAVVQKYIYDGDQIILMLDGSDSPVARYLWGPATDLLLAEDHLGASPQQFWPLGDHQNSVRDLVERDPQSGSAEIVDHVIYSAFGEQTHDTQPAINSLFGYTGRPSDPSTNLQNNLHRWYDAALTQWLSEDPIGFSAGDANTRRYVSNDPVNKVDPDGLDERLAAREMLSCSRNCLGERNVVPVGGQSPWADFVDWYHSNDGVNTPLKLPNDYTEDDFFMANGEYRHGYLMGMAIAALRTNQGGISQHRIRLADALYHAREVQRLSGAEFSAQPVADASSSAAAYVGARQGAVMFGDALAWGSNQILRDAAAHIANDSLARGDVVSQVGFGSGRFAARSLQLAAVVGAGEAALPLAAETAAGQTILSGMTHWSVQAGFIGLGGKATIDGANRAVAAAQNENYIAATESGLSAGLDGYLTYQAIAAAGARYQIVVDRSTLSMNGLGGVRIVEREAASVSLSIVPRRGMTSRELTAANGNSVTVWGQAEASSSTTVGHSEAMNSLVSRLAASGEYQYVVLQRAWRTATGRVASSRRMPDVIGVRRNGVVDAWEVRSATDDDVFLRQRLREGINTLPAANRGAIDVILPEPPTR